ncbi:MAG: glycosyltransferase [Mesorhizobium sp.]|nr:MAG: glycosyltransferase [Mesorhizobium sp.]
MKPYHAFYIGFDRREAAAFAVAKYSLNKHLITPVPVRGLVLSELRAKGLYTRPTEYRDGRIIDVLSKRADYDGAISTEFANSRFLVKELAKTGWAIFMDCDMLVRSNVERLFKVLDPSKAVMVVKHDFQPSEGVKMDGQIQTRYARKNWSSFCAVNCDHPANAALTVELVNSVPGRDLHAFCWLKDEDIGELDASWNWLVGHSSDEIDPDIVHFTDGIPTMEGYEECAFADEWRAALESWAAHSR